MKRERFILMLLACLFVAVGCDKQDFDSPVEIPVSDKAKMALENMYPEATNITWSQKGEYAVANFSLPASRVKDDNNLTAWFDNGGRWYMTETDILFSELPEAVQADFNASEYNSNSWQLEEVDKLEREGVETIFVIEVEKKENGVEQEVDLYYSSDGVLVKKVVDADKDYDYEDYIPSKPIEAIDEYIRVNYPNARIVEIDNEKGMTEVEIIDGRTPRELLFDGTVWVYTKTEVRKADLPATIVQALEASPYATYRIDDIDYYQTPDKEFYRFDLESAQGDVKIDIALDGTLSVKQPGDGNGQLVETGITEFISTKYVGATILEYDYDRNGFIEVEIWHENREKSVVFNGQNAWVYTEWDIRRNELPNEVLTAIASSQWATMEIDNIEYIQTPTGDYYQVELESGAREVELRITTDGILL